MEVGFMTIANGDLDQEKRANGLHRSHSWNRLGMQRGGESTHTPKRPLEQA